MNDNVQRHIVNWRSALILPQNATPLHGRAVEASEHSLVVLMPQEIKTGSECRIYLDVIDPANGQDVYLDFRIKVAGTALVGNISQFRHILHIIDIKPEQKTFFHNLLQQLGH